MTDITLDKVKTVVALKESINNEIFSCLMTQMGERAWIRDYGSDLPKLIHEPKDDTTAQLIKISAYRSLSRWIPRIQVDYASTLVTPTDTGYIVFIAYIITDMTTKGSFSFSLKK